MRPAVDDHVAERRRRRCLATVPVTASAATTAASPPSPSSSTARSSAPPTPSRRTAINWNTTTRHRRAAHADRRRARRGGQHHDVGAGDRDGGERGAAGAGDGDAHRKHRPRHHLRRRVRRRAGSRPAGSTAAGAAAWSDGTASFNRSDGARATYTFTGTAREVDWLPRRVGRHRARLRRRRVRRRDRSVLAHRRGPGAGLPGRGPCAGQRTPSPSNRPAARIRMPRTTPSWSMRSTSRPGCRRRSSGTRYRGKRVVGDLHGRLEQGDTTQAWSGGTAAVSSGVGRARDVRVHRDVGAAGSAGARPTWASRASTSMARSRRRSIRIPRRASRAIVYAVTGLAPGAAPARDRSDRPAERERDRSRDRRRRLRRRARASRRTMPASPTPARGRSTSQPRNWSDTSLTTGAGTAARSATAGARADVTLHGDRGELDWIPRRHGWASPTSISTASLRSGSISMPPAEAGPGADLHRVRTCSRARTRCGSRRPGTRTPRRARRACSSTHSTSRCRRPRRTVTRVQETNPAVTYSAGWTADRAGQPLERRERDRAP